MTISTQIMTAMMQIYETILALLDPEMLYDNQRLKTSHLSDHSILKWKTNIKQTYY